MAVYFTTEDPEKLLAEFKKKIDSKAIVTWSYDDDGDFTHTPSQWVRRAWLRPRIQNGKLALFVIPPREKTISTEVYAVFHGRFIESMLVHCDNFFSKGSSSAMPEGEDTIKG